MSKPVAMLDTDMSPLLHDMGSGVDSCAGCCQPPSDPPNLPPPPLSPLTGLARVFHGQDLDLMTALVTDAVLMLGCLALYIVLHWLHSSFFYTNPTYRARGPPPPLSPWGWLPLVWRLSEDEIEAHAGLDALVFLLFTKTLFKILLWIAPVAVVFELSIYCGCSFTIDSDDLPTGGLARLSLANVPSFDSDWKRQEPGCAWVVMLTSMLGVWWSTCVTIVLLRRGWLRVIAVRQRFMLDSCDVAAHTVLVITGGPAVGPGAPPLRSTQQTFELWDELYPNAVLDVLVIRETGQLPVLIEKRQTLVTALKNLEVKTAREAQRPDRHGEPSGWGCCPARCCCSSCCGAVGLVKIGEQVAEVLQHTGSQVGDALQAGASPLVAAQHKVAEVQRQWLASSLARIEEAIVLEQKRYASAAADSGRNYMVLFRTLRDSAIAKQVLNTVDDGADVFGEADGVIPAPLGSDMCWRNLQPSGVRKAAAMRIFVVMIYLASLIFFSVPVAAVASLLSLDSLERRWPWVRGLLDFLGEGMTAIISAWLPTVALSLFLAVLPAICKTLSELHGAPARSVEQRAAFEMLFFFELVWVFLGIAITNGLVSSLSDVIHSPVDALQTIGVSLSKTSVFFMVYLTLQFAVVMPALYLARVLPFLKSRAIGGWQWGSRPPPLESPPYHVLWSKVMLGGTIGLSFSGVNPVSTLFALTYLAVCYAIFARSLLFDFTNQSDSCGRLFWPVASKWLLVLLLTAQVLMAVIHSIKQSYFTLAGVLCTLVPTWMAHRHFTRCYTPKLSVLALLESARASGSKRSSKRATPDRSKTLSHLYQPQILTEELRSSRSGDAPADDSNDSQETFDALLRQQFRSIYFQVYPCSTLHTVPVSR